MFTAHFLFLGMTCSVYKEPLVYITTVRVLEIVQYIFCKSPLEVVVVMSICILLLSFVFSVSLVVVMHYRPFTVSLFAGTNFLYFVACHARSNMQGLVYIVLC